jgi:hypothetical protein
MSELRIGDSRFHNGRNLPYSADVARDLGHTNGEQARSINRSLGATDAIMAESLLTAILSCFRRHWS